MFWDFITLRQESTHQVSFLFSDRGTYSDPNIDSPFLKTEFFEIGTPYGYRHMNGYGSHTFKMVNAKDEPVYVKVNKNSKLCISINIF